MMTISMRPLTIDEKLGYLNEHFFYEVQQFLVGMYMIGHSHSLLVNIKLELSFLHARGLYEFLYTDTRKYEDDACSFDFVCNLKKWKDERPAKTKYITDALKQIDKELAHLTYKRHDGSSAGKLNTGDIGKIKDHLFKTVKIFLDNVHQGTQIMQRISNLETTLSRDSVNLMLNT